MAKDKKKGASKPGSTSGASKAKATTKAKPVKKSAPAKAKPAAKKPAPKKPAPKPVAKKTAPAKAKPVAKKPAPKKPAARPAPSKAAAKPAPKKAAAPSKSKPSAKAPVAEAKPATRSEHSRPMPGGALASADLERLRNILLDKRRQILDDLSKNKDANMESAEEGIQDIADKATSSYTREFLYSLSDNERQQIQLIDESLSRMELGGFGVCVACGNPISPSRLQAVPWARHCLSCQELQERGLL